MISIEELKKKGVDVETGLSRCVGKEDLYLKLVNMALSDGKFEDLGTALTSGDLDHSFELCHALKGVIGNLSLTPLYDEICAMTEKLRNREQIDYSSMYSKILEIRTKLSGS